jgi:hypothetical protein
MQWVFLYLSIGDDIGNISHSAGNMCRSTFMHVPHSCSECQWYNFQQFCPIMSEEISVVVACKPMWRNVRAYRTITNNPCPHINAELLLVSRMDYTMRVLLCPLVLVVNIHDAETTPASLNGCGRP